jgi:hypothetical protein
MYSNVKTPSDVTYLPAGSMGFVPTGHRPIKSRHVYQAGDKKPCLLLDMVRYLIVFIEIKNGGGTLHCIIHRP